MINGNQLQKYISFLETVEADQVVQWGGGDKDASGAVTMPYPIYDPMVHEMIEVIDSLNILDPDYLQTLKTRNIYTMKELDEAIDTADLPLTRAILTYFVKQERFCGGLWERAIEKHIFLRLLTALMDTCAIRKMT